MREQTGRTLEIVVRLFAHHAFEVGQGRRCVSKKHGANATSVKWVERIGTGGNGFIEGDAGFRQLAVVHVKITEFFIIPRRRIVANRGFEFTDALAARKNFEGLSEQSDVGQRLDNEIDERSRCAKKQDDEDPVVIRPAADKMDNRQPLEQEAPRI